MTASTPVIRTLLIYAICLPLAVLLGYELAQPLDITSLILLLVVACALATPFFLKYHHPFLVLALNSAAVVFLFPGRPQLWMLLAGVSLFISIIQKTLVPDMKFLRAPGVFWPLAALTVVTLVTAELTGGITFRFMGGDTAGGRRYFEIFGAIILYFALSARPIPHGRASLYIGLFFLGAVFSAVSSLANVMTHPIFNYIFLLFPPETVPGARAGADLGTIRFGGLGLAASGVYCFLLARYGIRGILLSGKPWRALVLGLFFCITLFSGYRSMLILLLLIFAFQFFLEGLARTKLLPILLFTGVSGFLILSLFASHLPFTVQRTMAFLPVKVDPVAAANARESTEWRVRMWRAVLPEVPQYLLLGKGYTMNTLEMESTETIAPIMRDASGGSAMASDFHNGPLTVIIPLGIWGVIAFLWFLWVAGRTLHLNHKYGDPVLRPYNTFLFAMFLAHLVLFLVVFGSLYTDLVKFTALLGMSVSLNRGVRHREKVPSTQKMANPAMALRTPRPALGKSL